MKSIIANFLFLNCLLFPSSQVMADHFDIDSWQSTKTIEKNDIKVELYNLKDSAIKAFKVETHVKASLDSILAVMMDSQSCMEWVHGCKGAKLIERLSFNEQYHYQICDIPFPFQDRDFIFHSVMTQNTKTKVVSISITSAPDYCNDYQSDLCKKINKSNLVRVKQSIGVYELRPDESGTLVIWTQHTDPAGKLPSWLVNQFVQDTPYWTMMKLAEKVQSNEYKQAKLIYNAEGLAVSIENIYKEKADKVNQFDHFASF